MTLRARMEEALDAGRPERAWDLAAEVWREGDWEVRHDTGRLLRWLAARVPEAAWTEDRAAMARRVGAGVSPPSGNIGAVAFPAVGPRGGRFVTARVTVLDAGPDQLAVEDPDTRNAVQTALTAARRQLDANPWFRVAFDAGGWTGGSCGLAVALAAVSAVTAREVRTTLVATGGMGADGGVRDVGADPSKVALREAARPRARMLVPLGWRVADDPALVPVGDLSTAVQQLTPGGGVDLNVALDQVWAQDRAGRWVEAARDAAALVDAPGLDPSERQRLLTVLLLAANHAADPDARTRWLARLQPEALTDDHLEAWARAVGSRMVGCVDDLDPGRAREVLQAAEGVRVAPRLRIHLDGPSALLATLEGRHADALDLRERNVVAATAEEAPRCLGDLADALLRVGRADEALARAAEGLSRTRGGARNPGYLERTRGYLTLHLARALVALNDPEEALRELDRSPSLPGPDPRLRVALLRAEIHRDVSRVEQAWQSIPDWQRAVPLVRCLWWRTLHRLGDSEAAGALVSLPVFRTVDADEAARRLPY